MGMIRFWCTIFVLIGCRLAAKEFQVVGVGSPCMDVLVNVEDSLVQSLGNKGGSQQVDMATLQTILDKTQWHTTHIAAGGSCANAIKGLAGFGHKCAFLGKIGNDDFGRQFVKNLLRWNIHPLISQSDHQGTQVCFCLITEDGERTMRCYPGASADITSQDLHTDTFKNTALVHFEGYSLYWHDKSFVPNAMKLAKESGALVSMDLSSFEVVKIFKETLEELLADYVDIVFANADEVRAFTGLEPYEGCLKLQQLCSIAVVMMGKNGCYVGSNEGILHSPANPIHLIDSTGAGDLFASGFLHGILKNYSLEECAHLGNKTGASVCETVGAEIPLHKWKDLRDEGAAKLFLAK